jgi:hypothetical protein
MGDQEVMSHMTSIEKSGKVQKGLSHGMEYSSPHMSGTRVQCTKGAFVYMEKEKEKVTFGPFSSGTVPPAPFSNGT